jgi:RNA polymerase sigma-70 factor (ECF subfamily)
MNKPDCSDAELVDRTLAGDHEAFGCLYDRYARLVRAIASRVATDWGTVQDLTQECFLRAYRDLRRLREPGRFGPWIVGIARNVARERRRSFRRDRHEFVGHHLLEDQSRSSGVDEAEDQFALVVDALATLPEREQEVIYAYFLQNRDARQTAELLGISLSGFYAVLQRSLRRLSELLSRECERDVK